METLTVYYHDVKTDNTVSRMYITMPTSALINELRSILEYEGEFSVLCEVKNVDEARRRIAMNNIAYEGYLTSSVN